MSFFWLTGMVVTTTYTANLIATLAAQKPKVPYKTLDNVAADDGFTLLIGPHSIQRIVLEVVSLYSVILILDVYVFLALSLKKIL